jgi:hemolysin activation/secretion protein/predicted porin
MLRRSLATLACATLSIAAPDALAQVPDAGRILDSIRERPSATPPAPARPVLEIPPDAPPARAGGPSAGRRVRVDAFQFQGNASLASAELQEALADLAGRELDLAELREAAARITRLYRARGFLVARAYLPEQDIAAGKITIAVLEGLLGRVLIERAPGMRLDEDGIRGILSRLRPGAPIRAAELDRALLLLTDLPGIAVRAQLRPGAQPGTADLVVRLSEGAALEARGSTDDFGNRYTGRIRTTAELTLNDRFGFGEQVSIRGLTSFEGLTAFNASWSAPLGDSGLRGGLGFAQLDYQIGKEFAPLGATGNADVRSAWLSYPLLRGRGASLWAQAGMENKRFHDNIESTNTITIRNTTLYTAALNGNWRDGVLGGARNSGSIQFGSGELRRNSAADAFFDANSAQSAGRFDKLNYSLSRLQALGAGWSLLGSISGQQASRNLDTSEKFYLGGPMGVRAYAQGEGAGDEGWLASLELRHALGEVGGFRAEGALFYDVGQVRIDRNAWDPAQLSDQKKLSGAGFGLTLVKDRAATISLGIAFKSANAPPTLVEPPRGRQIWIQVNALPLLATGPREGTAGGAQSQNGFDIYGTLGLMAERMSREGATPAGPRGATQSLTPTGNNLPQYLRLRDPTSYIGVRGSKPLGGGTDAFWQIESGLTYVYNQPSPPESGVPVSSAGSSLRDSAAGLRSASYGTAYYGKWDMPMKETSQALDPFDGNTIGSATNLIGSPGFGISNTTNFGPVSTAADANNDDAGFNRRQSGVWQYWSPEWNGASLRFAYSGNGRSAAPDVADGRIWGGSAVWRRGGFTVILGVEQHDNYFGIASLGRNNRGVGSGAAASITANTSSRDWSDRLSLGYSFGATQVSLMLDRVDYREFGVIPAATVPDLSTYARSAWMAMVKHQIGAWELRASYGQAEAGKCTVISGDPTQLGCSTDGLGARMFAAGFQYDITKAVALFGHYAQIRNDPSASYNFAVGGVFGAAGRTPGVGADPKGYGLGMKYTF